MNEIDEKRKERRRNLELVMFPASKNFLLDEESDEIIGHGEDLDDPLEELMQEFAEFEDEFDEAYESTEVIELSDRNEELFLQLTHKTKYSRSTSSDVIQEQIQLLRETGSERP